eukprot:Partr_v1_DN28300_c3_g1_i1_m75884 putative mitogen-activated protein kinase kinase kinase
MLALLLIFLIFAENAAGDTIDAWYFGSEGMQNATIFAQSKVPCIARIGQYSFTVSNAAVKQVVYLPAGNFPLTFFYNYGSPAEFGLRATIYVNGVLQPSTSWIAVNDFNGVESVPTDSCSSPWSVSEEFDFASLGGLPNERTLWPCPAQSSAHFLLYRRIQFDNKSPTARKVTFHVSADDVLPSASFGIFSFRLDLSLFFVMKYDIYVEPGVYLFQALVVDSGGPGNFIASIAIDDQIVTMTGDTGWTAFLENGSGRGPLTYATLCFNYWWGNLVTDKFVAAIGTLPQYIWAGIACDQANAQNEYARFQYSLDVQPRTNKTEYRKIDFKFAADDLFIMRIDSNQPVVGSPRDATDYFGAYFGFTPTAYSLYLLPGSYKLKFSIGNYDIPGYDLHLYGVISYNGTFIDATSSNVKWKDIQGNNATLCTALEWNHFLQEVELPFSNTGIQFISTSGGCRQAAGAYDIIYTLTVPGLEPIVSAPSSPSSFSTGYLSTGSLSTIDSSTGSSQRSSRSSRVASRLLSRRFSSNQAARRGSFISIITTNRVAFFISAIMLVIFLVLVFTWTCYLKPFSTRTVSSSQLQTKGKDSSLSTDGSTSEITNLGEITALLKTDIGTGFGNVLSVPAYLEAQEGMDFRVESTLNKSGAADVMIGTGFSAKLSSFGKRIVIKRFTNAGMNEKQRPVFFQEIAITAYLQNCRNIVRILGYSESPPSIILKMYTNGSLKFWLANNVWRRRKSMMFSFFKDITNGLSAIHRAGLIHCDIKSDNVLVDDNGVCVLCDFGITQVCDPQVLKVQAFVVANRQGFSLMYAAPEVFMAFRSRSSKRHYSSDIYACGVVGVELLNGGKLTFR